MGYSMRLALPTVWETARLDPSGDQSASLTFSSTSRGAPPESGTRAKVPELPSDSPIKIAISPEELIERMRPSGKSSDRDSRLPERIEKIVIGSAPHWPLKRMVWP